MDPSSNNNSPVLRIARLVEQLDRRWLYAILFLGVLLSLVFGSAVKVVATDPVKNYCKKIDSLSRAEGHIVIVAADFDPQTKAENHPQTVATVAHLMKNKIPFAMVTVTPTGTGFCEQIPRDLADKYGAKYGRDWVNWGYKYGHGIFIKALGSDIVEAVKTDAYNTPLGDIACMKGVKDASSVDLLCEVTGSVGVLEAWLQFFQKDGRRPDFLHGCTAVSGPSNYAYLDSGQLSGLLVGMLGAAEYEQVLEAPGWGLKGMVAQTAAHLLIIGFIIVGNIAELVRRRSEAAQSGEAA